MTTAGAKQQASYRKGDEGPPGSVTVQLAWCTAVKGNFANDEKVIAYPVPEPLVA